MIALEVGSGAGGEDDGVPDAIQSLVQVLLRSDPTTTYALCTRLSRWHRGKLFRKAPRNAVHRVIQDPANTVLLRSAKLFHSMGTFLPRTPRIPKIVTVHDLNDVRNPTWVNARSSDRRSHRIRRVVERADHVVTFSAFTANEVRQEYGIEEARVHVVPLGVDLNRFSPAPPQILEKTRERFGNYVLAIGRLTPRKNFIRLVEAVSHLRDLRLVLVGQPSDGAAEVRSAIRRFHMENKVELLENISSLFLTALLSAARVYAMSSLYEGFELTVLEAMACGVPVVCSDSASLPEVAEGAALMVDARDPENLRHGIERVCSDTSLAKELRARGFDRAELRSWTASAHRLRELYREVAGV